MSSAVAMRVVMDRLEIGVDVLKFALAFSRGRSLIIVKVERHNPKTGMAQTIGLMQIVRTQNEYSPSLPHFEAKVAKGEVFTDPKATVGQVFADPDKVVQVESFPRSKVSVWQLLREILTAAYGDSRR